MTNYLAQLPEYLSRCFQRLDLIIGVSLGVIFFLVALLVGLGSSVTVPVTMTIVIVAALEAGYFVYREERIVRAEREAKVRLNASPGSLAWNVPEPGAGKTRCKATICWEIWTDIDIKTARLCLNILGIRHKKWWQVFRPREVPLIGLPPKGQDTFQYRKTFRAIDPQPIIGDTEFEYEGPLDWPDKEGEWALELVLETGSPAGTYRAIVDSRLWERGTREPL